MLVFKMFRMRSLFPCYSIVSLAVIVHNVHGSCPVYMSPALGQ